MMDIALSCCKPWLESRVPGIAISETTKTSGENLLHSRDVAWAVFDAP